VSSLFARREARASGFHLTEKQVLANRLLGSPATHIFLRGGSRSGKTFIIMRAITTRAMRANGSTHAVLRLRFNHLKQSIIEDTFPKMMKLCYPGMPYHLNRSDWWVEFPNNSRILFGGLDDKERTEKILGQEHSSIFLNECSQIPYASRNKAMTRLAQTSSGLALKAYYDANPPNMGHWTYKMFALKQEPTSGAKLARPEAYATMQMNPVDNMENLSEEYITILESLPAKERKRFLDGEFLPQVEGALWTLESIDRNRITEDQLPELRRIVVSIDPSGCQGPEDKRSDEIGITTCAVGRDGQGYVLDDLSGHYSPEGWAKAALTTYDMREADIIIGERNFGGAMVESTVRALRRNVPFKLVTASRGKTQRAEPVAALYEKDRVKHVGIFPELEDQLCEFSNAGYQGERSPDRADAAIWGLTELMLTGVRKYGMLEVV
jgi:phage terminase large subunit-like protein